MSHLENADAGNDGACVYCLHTAHMAANQVLWRGADLYLCAPLGQMVEGYLCVAPYACTSCMANLPAAAFGELAKLQQHVRNFYAKAYGTADWLFYEQGRAGAGARVDPMGRFPLHAHLCSIPATPALHAALASAFRAVPVDGPASLPSVAVNEPYLYVQCPQQAVVYLGRDEAGRQAIARSRLKPQLASLCGWPPQRGDWRLWPGSDELERLIRQWRQTWPSLASPD